MKVNAKAKENQVPPRFDSGNFLEESIFLTQERRNLLTKDIIVRVSSILHVQEAILELDMHLRNKNGDLSSFARGRTFSISPWQK